MSGGVPRLSCRNRLRSSDTKVKIKEEKKMHSDDEEDITKVRRYEIKVKNMTSSTILEKGKRREMPIILSDDDEEEVEMSNCFKNVKNRKASTANLEKEKRRKIPINPSDDNEEEELEMRNSVMKVKIKEEKMMCGGDDKVKNRKASFATFEKEKKRKMLSSHSGERKMNSGDHDKDKRRSTPLPLDKNKDFSKKKKKMLSSHSSVKKMHSGDRDKDKRRSTPLPLDKNKDFLKKKKKVLSSHSFVKKMHSDDRDKDKRRNMILPCNESKHFEKEKKKMLSSHNGEKKMWCSDCDHVKDKKRSMPHPFNRNEMQKSETKKRMGPITYIAKEKKMQPSDRMEVKVKNGHNKEEKKNASPALSKENKIHTLTNNKKVNKRKAATMVFKKGKKMRTDDKDKMVGGYDRGKEKKMECDDKEQKVHSGGKENKRNVPLAFLKVVLNNFEEFLLIPPMIAPKLADLTDRHVYLEDSEGKSSKIRLSVVEGSLAFYQGWKNFVSDHLIKWGDFLLFEYTAMSKFSVRVFGMDSSERLCFNVEMKGGTKKPKESHAPGNLVPCHRSGNSEDINGRHYVSGERLGSKGPETKADGYMNYCKIAPDNLVAKSLDAASGTRQMAVNTKGNPNRVVRGLEHGPSVALDNKDGYLANGDRKAKNSSPTCSKEETRKFEIIPVTNVSPLTQENEDTVKLTPLNAASGTRYVTANTKEDPEEVAIGAWCGPSVALDKYIGSLAIEECKTKSISPTCWKQKARSEVILITDASPLEQENDDAVELTTCSHHIEDTSMIRQSEPEVATPTKCMEIHDSDEDLRREHKGNTVQLEYTTVVGKCPNNSNANTNGNILRKYEAPGGSRCLEKWNRDIMRGQAALDGTGLIRPGKQQKTVEKLIGNCSVVGLNPAYGSDSTRLCIQPMPGKISKSGHTATEIDHSVDGEGSTFQFRTKKEQLEHVGSIVSRQRNNIPAHANHVVACQSEHHFFRQEDVKYSNRVSSGALMSVKVEVLELDGHSMLKTNLQFCIPSTTLRWLELPNSLSNAIRQKGRQDRSIIILKDPMKRLWPVFYHENAVFVGFTRGWKRFVAANNLERGDLCTLLKDLDEDEPVYHVNITKKRGQC